MIRIVNAYGPTSPKAAADPTLFTNFYNELDCAANCPSRYELFFLGDFNSKLGKVTKKDDLNGLSQHIGMYGNGTRNRNGEELLNFIINHDLFVCNTAFKHKMCHITTRTGYIRV